MTRAWRDRRPGFDRAGGAKGRTLAAEAAGMEAVNLHN